MINPEVAVVFELYIAGLASVCLAFYLGYALFHPEKF